MDCSVAEVTVRVALGLVHIPPLHPELALLAVTWAVPPANVSAWPLGVQDVPTSHTRATLVLSEIQVTELVMFWVEASLKVPVAVNCCVPPRLTDGVPGVTAMEVSRTAMTLS